MWADRSVVIYRIIHRSKSCAAGDSQATIVHLEKGILDGSIAFYAAKKDLSGEIIRLLWITTAQLWFWLCGQGDVVSVDTTHGILVGNRTQLGALMTRNPCASRDGENTLVSLACFFIRESVAGVQFIKHCLMTFLDKFGISSQNKHHDLPFQVILHDGAKSFQHLFGKQQDKSPSDKSAADLHSSNFPSLRETVLRFGAAGTEMRHYAATHEMASIRCTAYCHLPKNWRALLDSVTDRSVQKEIISAFWTLTLISDAAARKLVDREFIALVRKYSSVSIALLEGQKCWTEKMEQESSAFSSSSSSCPVENFDLQATFQNFDICREELDILVNKTVSDLGIKANIETSYPQDIDDFASFLQTSADQLRQNEIQFKLFQNIIDEAKKLKKTAKETIVNKNRKRKHSDTANQKLANVLLSMYKPKKSFLRRYVDSAFNCAMHASSWCEAFHSALKRKYSRFPVSLLKALHFVDSYNCAKFIDAMQKIQELQSSSESNVHAAYTQNSTVPRCFWNGLNSEVRKHAYDLTSENMKKSLLYSLNVETKAFTQ